MLDFREIMKRIMEGSELDRTSTFPQSEFSLKGRADIAQRVTNARYGDNPMEEIAEDDGDEMMLMRLHTILTDAGVSDDEIISGVSLNDNGKQIVADELKVDAERIPMLLTSLTSSLRNDEPGPGEVSEDIDGAPQFSYEKDYLNNVTIRDAHSGKEAYLQGSQASALLSQLQVHPDDEQNLLSGYESLMEDDDGSFDDEIESDGNTYNMPWTIGQSQGTMTVMYSGDAAHPILNIESFRDKEGKEIAVPAQHRASLMKQAQDFIGKA